MVSSCRTAARLRRVHAHLAAAAQEVEEELYSDPDPDRVQYTSHDTYWNACLPPIRPSAPTGTSRYRKFDP